VKLPTAARRARQTVVVVENRLTARIAGSAIRGLANNHRQRIVLGCETAAIDWLRSGVQSAVHTR